MSLTGTRQATGVRPSRVGPSITSSPTRINTPQSHSPTPSPLHNGDIVGGRFQVRRPLGAGGCGQVYTGTDTETGNPIVLKIAPAGLERIILRNETKVLETLAGANSPRIVSSYGGGETKEFAYVAMEYIDGASLFEEIHYSPPGGEISLPRALELVSQICYGLEAAANKGITHRDIKPANIMIDGFGLPKIIDWGLARRSGPFGTLEYAAPEQIRGGTVDHRVDIYSLGLVFYEMLTRKIPFHNIGTWSDPDPVLLAKKQPDQLKISGVTDSVQQLINKMTAPFKENRHQSYGELRDDIARIQEELTRLNQRIAGIIGELDTADPLIELQANIPTGIIGDAVQAAAKQSAVYQAA